MYFSALYIECCIQKNQGNPGCYPWLEKNFGRSPRSKQVAEPSLLCSHRLWTWFLQIHTLLFTWSLLFGWLPDPNSTIAGMLWTLPNIRLSQTQVFILCITSHFHTKSKRPVEFPPSAHSVIACFVLSGKVNIIKGSFNKRRIAWKGQERALGGEPPSNED